MNARSEKQNNQSENSAAQEDVSRTHDLPVWFVGWYFVMCLFAGVGLRSIYDAAMTPNDES
jgi:hypothetical protein